MEFEKIIELIQAVSDSNLTQFQIQDGDWKISMKTDKETKQTTVAVPVDMALPASASIGKVSMGEEENGRLQGNVVKSPLVGTYYQASSPDNDPFIQVGDVVKKGQVLGIVEAMKLMNEIESEFDGTVKEILVENEQMVEYGQPMFVIE
ncbi:acetyl-CoA carboxylase biotin carboxyl carrier protein [Blautia schinkii]|nr:acetyl-CoA carboxylase biotin carboxyl carrier protein [Blautia schinkii]